MQVGAGPAPPAPLAVRSHPPMSDRAESPLSRAALTIHHLARGASSLFDALGRRALLSLLAVSIVACSPRPAPPVSTVTVPAATAPQPRAKGPCPGDEDQVDVDPAAWLARARTLHTVEAWNDHLNLLHTGLQAPPDLSCADPSPVLLEGRDDVVVLRDGDPPSHVLTLYLSFCVDHDDYQVRHLVALTPAGSGHQCVTLADRFQQYARETCGGGPAWRSSSVSFVSVVSDAHQTLQFEEAYLDRSGCLSNTGARHAVTRLVDLDRAGGLHELLEVTTNVTIARRQQLSAALSFVGPFPKTVKLTWRGDACPDTDTAVDPSTGFASCTLLPVEKTDTYRYVGGGYRLQP